MGQYWDTIAVSCRERWIGQTGTKLGEWFWHREVMGLAYLLLWPHWADDVSCTAQWTQLSHESLPTTGTPTPRQAEGILSLPVELVLAIFDHIDDTMDVFNMCLAHEFLGAVGEPLAHERIVENYAPWAGQAILCVGDYLLANDLPAGLEPYVAEDIRDLVTPASEDDSREFFGKATRNYRGRGMRMWYGGIPKLWHAGELTRADEQKVAQLAQKLEAVERTTYAPSDLEDAHLVLFNLSKQQYVRRAPVQDLNKRLVDPKVFRGKEIDLGHVLLAHICWSSDPGCAMDVDSVRLTRGPWAGDKFEVMYVGQSRTRLDSEKWQDVTDDTIAWLEELWRSSWSGIGGF